MLPLESSMLVEPRIRWNPVPRIFIISETSGGAATEDLEYRVEPGKILKIISVEVYNEDDEWGKVAVWYAQDYSASHAIGIFNGVMTPIPNGAGAIINGEWYVVGKIVAQFFDTSSGDKLKLKFQAFEGDLL